MDASATEGEKKGGAVSVGELVAHPLRSRCLTILADHPASPAEIARELGQPVANVAYHVRSLERMGAIELVRTRQVRGAIEHTYRAVTRPRMSDEECEATSPEEWTKFARLIFSVATANASTALDSGTIGNRPDLHVSRTPIRLDEKGWKELGEAYEGFAAEVLDIQEESVARLADKPSDPGIPVISFLSFFEMPDTRSAS